MDTVPVNFIPRNLYYSTMLFLTTERRNEQAKQWELIFPEPDTQV